MRVVSSGWRYGGVLAALAVPALLLTPLVSLGFIALAAGTVWFHRDPERLPPPDGVVAPADGHVSVLREEPDGRIRVGTFMNVTDVHVNRAPAPGTVASVEHTPGAHWPAFSKESDRNERVTISAEGWELTLIAGAFARRIHPTVVPGERINRGERVGYVSFGSRADVLLPAAVTWGDLRVSKGDRIRAGETVLAEVELPGERETGQNRERAER